MKQSIIYKIVFFVLLIITADWFVGIILEHLYKRSEDITISKIRYTLHESEEDVLVFGSSRAQHHYIPDILVEGTNYTSFNCGLGGQPLAFSLVQISETLKRYKPQTIILDVTPDFRFDVDSDPRLKILGPYYKTDTLVRKILLDNGSKFEKLKYLSSIYPYNGMLADIVLAWIYVPDVSIKGYIPSPQGTVDQNWLPDEDTADNQDIPAKQVQYLKRIVDICRKEDVSLWIIISPLYRPTMEEEKISIQIKDFAEINNISFIDFSFNQTFSDYRFFKDHLHLTTSGAEIFSTMVRDSVFNGRNILIDGGPDELTSVN
jgi:hypothetical protein